MDILGQNKSSVFLLAKESNDKCSSLGKGGLFRASASEKVVNRTKPPFIMTVLLTLLVCQSNSYATVFFAGNEDSSIQKEVVKDKTKSNHQVKQHKIKQYNIEGYTDSKYVRFVVEVTKNNLVTGQMKLRDGTNKYVSGELIDGVFQLYDRKGKHFTVIVPSNSSYDK